jgi:hypothetical protein
MEYEFIAYLLPLCFVRSPGKICIWICLDCNGKITLLTFIKIPEQPDTCVWAFPQNIEKSNHFFILFYFLQFEEARW